VIEVGLTLPNYRATAGPANILETAERADRLGFHSVWVADHITIPVSYASTMGTVFYETHTTLSVVAGRTTRLKLGCSVMPTPYRHPLLQARSLATLDQLSGGRVIYGGATGYMVDEFSALGVDFSKRAAITDEYLQVLKLAWTEPVITFHGQFVDCTNMTCDPKPVQRPHPPIWLGGDSDGAFRRIARYADGWHGLPGGSPGARRVEPSIDNFAARIERLHHICEQEGRDPASITLSIKAACQIGADESRPLHGSAAKIVDDIKRLEALGVALVVLAPNLLHEPTSLDVVDQIASEILNPVRDHASQAL
jgi:probable F420-dependent oxidoreductase